MTPKYLFFVLFFSLFSKVAVSQNPAIFEKYSNLESEVLSDENLIYIVNFWATWCAPCVKELPYFEKLNSENKQLKVVLISLDFKDQYETKLVPFLKKKSIKTEVVALTDKDYNTWLSMVDENWSGSIPATLIKTKGEKIFEERMFSSYEDLLQFVNASINQ